MLNIQPPTNALGVRSKAFTFAKPSSPLRSSVPNSPTRQWPTHSAANEVVMAHTVPVQEKFNVSNSSTHDAETFAETLVEDSETVTCEILTLRNIPDALPFSWASF